MSEKNKPLSDNANNWYAKLHPIGKEKPQNNEHETSKKLLNLSLFFRIWIAVGIIVIISGIVVFNQLFNYVRPITRQVIEDTLVDTSKLLATSLRSAVESGDIYDSRYQAMLDDAFLEPNLSPNTLAPAEIPALQAKSKNSNWYHKKTRSSFRVYVTDKNGKVIYDSLPKNGQPNYSNAEGQDYSKWNDVHLSLNGKYGARTTRIIKDDASSSVMYVAQPIYSSKDKNKLIGVVSVGKPTATVIPYIDATRKQMLTASLYISIITLIMAGLVAWWLRQSTLLVTRYTQSLAQDTIKPYFYLGRELNELSDTIESMKHRLENRAYVTDYVHTLTHELKSPLTAIRASGELLEAADLDCEDRLMLSQTITEQSIKLQSLIDRLLLLAKIEQPSFKLTLQQINPDSLIKRLIAESEIKYQNEAIKVKYLCEITEPQNKQITADEFWINQALQNVLDNALYFANNIVIVKLTTQKYNRVEYIKFSIFNDGDLIPEYALEKVFDRYFSLSHQYQQKKTNTTIDSNDPNQQNAQPNSQVKKGTGLGLTLVRQVIERHGGMVDIFNREKYEIDSKSNIENFRTENSRTENSSIKNATIENGSIDNRSIKNTNIKNDQTKKGVEVIILLPVTFTES